MLKIKCELSPVSVACVGDYCSKGEALAQLLKATAQLMTSHARSRPKNLLILMKSISLNTNIKINIF